MSHNRLLFTLAAVLFAGSALMAVPAVAQSNQRTTKPAKVEAPLLSKVERAATPFQFPVGSLVIVNNERRLYYITGKGEAVRYRVAVGKNEELWMGRTFVAAKVVDPKWIPVNGDDPVEGGDAANPLGKRALYLDWSLLRIHGTPSRGSIGSATSNGCIRMLNEDVLDLFDRVHFGAPVYAIRSWKEASLFDEAKVAEKLYHDPEAHREAQEDLKEQIRERAEEQKDKEATLRKQPASQSRVQTATKQSSSRQVASSTLPRLTSGFSGRVALDAERTNNSCTLPVHTAIAKPPLACKQTSCMALRVAPASR